MREILEWYQVNGRSLPWRETTDPYRILVSEMMLQQTQVPRVIEKYTAWIAAFPDWESLAAASRAEVLLHWQGLGYNSRAVRLHALAKFVAEEKDGKLPETEEELQQLPGIGPYTAGAIRVFAFDKKGNCIDVNVERILKRVFFPKTKTISKKELQWAFDESFPDEARDWGNALMDFGSLVCTAKNPKCNGCPAYSKCKSQGERPEENSERQRKKQPTFLHSNRWWRGQILKALHGKELLEKQLYESISHDDEEMFKNALAQLATEKMIEKKKKIRIKN